MREGGLAERRVPERDPERAIEGLERRPRRGGAHAATRPRPPAGRVVAAVRAHAVRELRLPALRASLYAGGSAFQLAARLRSAPCSASSSGRPWFLLPLVVSRCRELGDQHRPARRTAVDGWSPGHSPRLRSPPQTAHRPWHPGRHSGENGTRPPTASRTICSGSSSPVGTSGYSSASSSGVRHEQLARPRRRKARRTPSGSGRTAASNVPRDASRTRGCPRPPTPAGGRRRAVRRRARGELGAQPSTVPRTAAAWRPRAGRPGHGRRSCASIRPPARPPSSKNSVLAPAPSVRPNSSAAVAGARSRSRPSSTWSSVCASAPGGGLGVLEDLAQRDLELRELRVDVVLGLRRISSAPVLASARISLGLFVSARRDDLLLQRHPALLLARLLDDPLPVAARLRQELLAVLHDPAGLLDLLRKLSCISPTSRSTSSRLTSTDEDSGMDFASLHHLLELLQPADDVHQAPPPTWRRAAARTCAGTSPSTSPPRRATSFTSEDDRNDHFGLVGRTASRRRRSVVHLRHLDLVLVVAHGPQALHDHRAPAAARTPRAAPGTTRPRRSAGPAGLLEHGDPLLEREQRRLGGFSSTATTTWSNRCCGPADDVQWPLVTGSNVPGHRAVKPIRSSRYRVRRLSPYRSRLADGPVYRNHRPWNS